ncbi:MAG: hypothetical protein OEZ10_11120 [Gammaproteobacteria bacterium]|nr:hypothetical protein [Gammaproteobacteria bacterium]
MNESMQDVARQGIVAILLFVVLAWTPFVEAASFDRSDLNNDKLVDFLDLEIFSNRYLEQDWQTVDWCRFYESSVQNEKYFRQNVSATTGRFSRLFRLIVGSYNCQFVPPSVDKSDLNADGIVDLADLTIFSTNYLQIYWESVDWCLFYANTIAESKFNGRPTRYFLQHFRVLLSFINDRSFCAGGEAPGNALLLESTPRYLARITAATDMSGDYYITDPRVGSLFIYGADLKPKAEIKGLDKPLGVAVDRRGYILVGNDGRDNIEVYNPANGELLAVFGEGLVKMPSAITVDMLGNIYVTDSLRNHIRVFDIAYNPVGIIGKSGEGQGELKFPVDAKILTMSDGIANREEIFVADQGNKRVQVYDLEGNWLRSITFAGTKGQRCSWFTGKCEIPGAPAFARLQSLDTDSFGRLHVLDNFRAAVIVFDVATGGFLNFYGEYGSGAGTLRVPMDVLISQMGTAIITTGDGNRVEVLTIP